MLKVPNRLGEENAAEPHGGGVCGKCRGEPHGCGGVCGKMQMVRYWLAVLFI